MKRKLWIGVMALIIGALSVATPQYAKASACEANTKRFCVAVGEPCPGGWASCCSTQCLDGKCE
jgi:hypothetical protein